MGTMHTDLTTTPRLAAAIKAAKAGPPRLTWETVRANGGPSKASMTTYAKGDGSPISDHGCDQLDAGLGWLKGTARSLVDPPLAEVPRDATEKPTIHEVVDGRVVAVDRPDLVVSATELRDWLEMGQRILESVERMTDSQRTDENGARR